MREHDYRRFVAEHLLSSSSPSSSNRLSGETTNRQPTDAAVEGGADPPVEAVVDKNTKAVVRESMDPPVEEVVVDENTKAVVRESMDPPVEEVVVDENTKAVVRESMDPPVEEVVVDENTKAVVSEGRDAIVERDTNALIEEATDMPDDMARAGSGNHSVSHPFPPFSRTY
jgi:hypothetical protein